MTTFAVRDDRDDSYDKFDAKCYLQHYFELAAVGAKLHQYVSLFSQFPDDSMTMLNYGGGPDLLPLLYAAHKIKGYVHADYAPNNLREVENWTTGDPSAFNWQRHLGYCLELESRGESVERREKRMREVIKAVVHCDMMAEQIIRKEYQGPYDYVICSGVLDSVCQSTESFSTAVKRLSDLVKVGGYLHIEMSYGTDENKCSGCYEVGGIVYKTVLSVTKAQIIDTIKAQGFRIMHVLQYVDDCEETAGYKDNAVMVVGRKD
ncbi:hypothetical protein EMCRGX_G007420 [Ephydatia muelleri]|eukprot:Em0002g1093a